MMTTITPPPALATKKQLANTHTAKDAVRMAAAANERLQRYANYADFIVDASMREADTVAAIKRDGILHIPNFFDRQAVLDLGEQLAAAIASRLPNLKVRDHREENKSGEGSSSRNIRHITLSDAADWDEARHYTTVVALPDPLVHLPAFITQLLANERLLDIVMGFYESVPLLSFVKSRISLVGDLPATDTQHWHTDPGSYRTLRVLIYLNDIDEGGGPFQYIATSQINHFDGWDSQLRWSSEELARHYAPALFRSCTARAGDILFAEGTGFHRGQRPITVDRRIIILNFCVHSEVEGLPYDGNIRACRDVVESLPPLARALFDEIELIGG